MCRQVEKVQETKVAASFGEYARDIQEMEIRQCTFEYILSLTQLQRDCVRLGLRVTGHWACKTHPGQQTVLASLATRKLESTSIVSPFHHHPPQPFTLFIAFSFLNSLESSRKLNVDCQIFILYLYHRYKNFYILKSRQKCRR